MNNVREVNRINERELDLAVEGGASWHDDYRDSAYIFVGNLDKRLTEGDVITIFSQYGEVLDINLPRIPEGGLQQQRDRDQPPPGSGSGRDGGSRSEDRQQQQQQPAGKPGDRRGFGFLLYEDQKSTILAVDNLNGFNLLGRTIRVDHVKDYKMPGARKREEEGGELLEPSRNAAPTILNDRQRSDGSEGEGNEDELDLADPMASYIAASKRDKSGSKEDKEERRQRKEERRRRREEKDRRKRKSEEVATREEDVIKRHRSSHDYDDRRSSSHRSERERDERRSYRDTYEGKEERESRRRPDESRTRVHRDDDHRDTFRREREPNGPPRDYDRRSREHERNRERDYDRRR